MQEVEEEGAGRNVTVSTTIGVQLRRGEEECFHFEHIAQLVGVESKSGVFGVTDNNALRN